jgi:hypothetical protein
LPLLAEVACAGYAAHCIAVSIYGKTVLFHFLDPIFTDHENLPELLETVQLKAQMRNTPGKRLFEELQ